MSPSSLPAFATTVVAATAAATARLIDQILAFHPTATVAALSVDGTPARADFVVAPDELPVPREEVARRLGRTAPGDAAAALLPELGRLLLGTHEGVVLLDPTIEVLGELGELAVRSGEHLRLVPRCLGPVPVDDRHPDLLAMHRAGVHLPTMVGAGRGADDLLGWWSAETARRPNARGALLDLAMTWAVVSTVRSPGHGVNPSRITRESRIVDRPTGPTIEGVTIATVDTTGHDRDTPHLFGSPAGPRALLGDHHALAEVIARRDEALGDDDPPAHAPDARTRLYAAALRRHELLGEPEPPSRDSAAFTEWLRAPADRVDGLPRVAVGLWHARADLRAPFPAPDLGPVNRAAFLDWLRRDGVVEEDLDPSLVPDPTTVRREPTVAGVDLAGYIDAEVGVGEIARLIGLALEARQTPTAVQTVGGSANRQTSTLIAADDGPRHPVEILCVNADRVADVVASRGRHSRRVHTIGVFFWEADVATPGMERGIEAVDEIWAGSSYVADQFRRWTARPVHVLPIPVIAAEPRGDGRTLLGIEAGRPIVMLAYDFHSIARRKNPDGLIEAFRRAVPADDGPVLMLKSINGDRVPNELDRLRWTTRDRDDINILDGYVERGALAAMIQAASVYASLHRSEGFGLTIAHAMALGTPVLCTAGSGPVDYLDEHTATIVPATRVPVGPGAEPYPPEGTWWEPDLDAAAAGLQTLLTDPAAAEGQAKAAADSISERDLETTSAFVERRLAQVRRQRKPWQR